MVVLIFAQYRVNRTGYGVESEPVSTANHAVYMQRLFKKRGLRGACLPDYLHLNSLLTEDMSTSMESFQEASGNAAPYAYMKIC